ncbi:MAG: DUF4870 domain-containing protein [Candidatus Paceibacterota bacterium]
MDTMNDQDIQQEQVQSTTQDSHLNTAGPEQQDRKSTEEDNELLMGILAYLGPLFLVPLLAAKENDFAQYHAKQGAALFIGAVAIMMIAWFPIIGWLIGFVAWIAWVVLTIIGIMNVVQKKKKSLPIVGGLAKHF